MKVIIYRLISQPEDKTAAITAKELKIGDLKIKDKYYDGTPCLLGLVDGDRLELLNGVPTFDSINAGKNISVSFTEFTLSGDNVTVGNYRLTPPLGITADILEYISDGNEYSVNSNNWINTDFVITAKDGYLLSLTNTADGKWSNTLTASEETANGAVTYYVKNTVNGAISTKITQGYKAEFSKFVKVLIDGAELDKKHYTVYEGSTVVEIREEYLSSLAPGNHTMSIVSVNGKADTVFTVVKEEKTVSPKTGETNNPSLWIALLFVSGGIFGITATAQRKRKRTENSL